MRFKRSLSSDCFRWENELQLTCTDQLQHSIRNMQNHYTPARLHVLS